MTVNCVLYRHANCDDCKRNTSQFNIYNRPYKLEDKTTYIKTEKSSLEKMIWKQNTVVQKYHSNDIRFAGNGFSLMPQAACCR